MDEVGIYYENQLEIEDFLITEELRQQMIDYIKFHKKYITNHQIMQELGYMKREAKKQAKE